MKLPLGQNFHDAYDAIMGAGKEDKYDFPGGRVIKALDEQDKFFKENEMVNVHEHAGCQHEELKYCKVCELTYCKKCFVEWGTCRQAHYYTYVQPATTWTSPYITTSGTLGTTWSGTITYQCNHS